MAFVTLGPRTRRANKAVDPPPVICIFIGSSILKLVHSCQTTSGAHGLSSPVVQMDLRTPSCTRIYYKSAITSATCMNERWHATISSDVEFIQPSRGRITHYLQLHKFPRGCYFWGLAALSGSLTSDKTNEPQLLSGVIALRRKLQDRPLLRSGTQRSLNIDTLTAPKHMLRLVPFISPPLAVCIAVSRCAGNFSVVAGLHGQSPHSTIGRDGRHKAFGPAALVDSLHLCVFRTHLLLMSASLLFHCLHLLSRVIHRLCLRLIRVTSNNKHHISDLS